MCYIVLNLTSNPHFQFPNSRVFQVCYLVWLSRGYVSVFKFDTSVTVVKQFSKTSFKQDDANRNETKGIRRTIHDI